jgi:hypothetical protein
LLTPASIAPSHTHQICLECIYETSELAWLPESRVGVTMSKDLRKDRVDSNERRSLQQKLPPQSGHTLQSGHRQQDESQRFSFGQPQVNRTPARILQRSISASISANTSANISTNTSANNGRTAQESTQPIVSTSPKPNPLPTPVASSAQKPRHSFKHLSRALKHPLMLVGFAWSTVMLIAGIAAVSIVHIEPFEQNIANSDATEQHQPQPETLQPLNDSSPTATPQDSNVQPPSRLRVSAREEANLPFLTLGLVALSCAATSFFLSYRSRPKQVGNRSHLPSKHRRLPRHISSKTSFKRKAESTSSHQENHTFTQSAPVTVLPSEQDHPLDWQEPSVADHLDLRQRRPLSYWL